MSMMWSTLGDRLASLGEALTVSAEKHAKEQREQRPDEVSTNDSQTDVLGSLRQWSQAVMQSTKLLVEEQARHSTQPYKRDVCLPLDVEALRDAEVVYVTDRIVTLSHPFLQSTTDGNITPQRKLAAVGHLLHKRHGGRFMVWNLSEMDYDTRILDDQVLVYKFPGSPSPPLGLLLKLLLSLDSWLKADHRNVAVIHCLTGKGRTSTVLAAFLCWTGEAGFHDVTAALEYIARCKRVPVDTLTIPSQIRYVTYFANMLDGVRPSQPPLMLKRVIMSEAPSFGRRQVKSSPTNAQETTTASTNQPLSGCAPYLQIFKAGNLIFTTPASVNYAQPKDDLPFCTTQDGPVSFLTEAVLQGDILLRCRHLTRSGQRISMFRCAFHTGYIPPKVLRLTKAQLDGACGDKRFSKDFFLDLIFEPCDEATAAKHLLTTIEHPPDTTTPTESANEAEERRSMGTVGQASNTVSASAYDSMLHRDSRFWEVIAARRHENRKKMAEFEKMDTVSVSQPNDSIHQPMAGPTIGKRRDFASHQLEPTKQDSLHHKEPSSTDGKPTRKPQTAISVFSIGEEFSRKTEQAKFLSSSTSISNKPVIAPPSPPQKPKKDALMDALNDLEDDFHDDSNVGNSPDSSLPIMEQIDFNVNELSFKRTPQQETLSTVLPNTCTTQSDSTDQTFAKTSRLSAIDDICKSDDANVSVKNQEETDNDATGNILDHMGDDMADLNIDNGDENEALLGDDGEYDDLDNLEDDAELDDLENFLTQVGKTQE